MFNQNNWIGAGLLGIFQKLHNKAGVPGGTIFHFGVVPVETFGWISSFHAESFKELVFTKSVCVGTFCSIITTFNLDNPGIRILRTYRTINIDRLVEDRLLVLAKNKSIFNAKVLHVNKNKLNQWTIGLIYDKYGIDGIDTLSRILCKKEKWNNMYTVFSYMLLIENWNKK